MTKKAVYTYTATSRLMPLFMGLWIVTACSGLPGTASHMHQGSGEEASGADHGVAQELTDQTADFNIADDTISTQPPAAPAAATAVPESDQKQNNVQNQQRTAEADAKRHVDMPAAGNTSPPVPEEQKEIMSELDQYLSHKQGYYVNGEYVEELEDDQDNFSVASDDSALDGAYSVVNKFKRLPQTDVSGCAQAIMGRIYEYLDGPQGAIASYKIGLRRICAAVSIRDEGSFEKLLKDVSAGEGNRSDFVFYSLKDNIRKNPGAFFRAEGSRTYMGRFLDALSGTQSMTYPRACGIARFLNFLRAYYKYGEGDKQKIRQLLPCLEQVANIERYAAMVQSAIGGNSHIAKLVLGYRGENETMSIVARIWLPNIKASLEKQNISAEDSD